MPQKPKDENSDLARILLDPDPQGCFVGGPPLLSEEELQDMIENPAKMQEEAAKKLEEEIEKHREILRAKGALVP